MGVAWAESGDPTPTCPSMFAFGEYKGYMDRYMYLLLLPRLPYHSLMCTEHVQVHVCAGVPRPRSWLSRLCVKSRCQMFLLMCCQGEQLIARRGTDSHLKRPNNLHNPTPDPDVVQQVQVLKSQLSTDLLSVDVTARSVIDNRTDDLVKRTTKVFQECDWWLNGECECSSPIYDYFASYFLQMGR